MSEESMNLEALKAQMQAQEQARMMVEAAMQNTIRSPARILQVLISKAELVDHHDGQRKVLLIGQPSGERIDVVLSVETVRALRRAIAEPTENGAVEQ